MRPVLVVTAEDGRHGEATARHTVDMSRRLRDVGVDVTVVSWRPLPLAAELEPGTGWWSPVDLEELVAVRALRGAGLDRPAEVAKHARLRIWLRSHRDDAILLDGAAAAEALPWLRGHRGPVLWHLHAGEEVPLEQATSAAAVGRIVVTEPRQRDRLAAHGRSRGVTLVPPHHPVAAAPAPVAPTLGMIGPLDHAHGVDLLPRLLWLLDRRLEPGIEVPVLWAAPPGAEWPAAVRHDLRHLRLSERVEIGPPEDLDDLLPLVSGLVLPWRDGSPSRWTWEAGAAGRPSVAFTLDDTENPLAGDGVPFLDLPAMADAVAGWFSAEGRRDAERVASETRTLTASIIETLTGPVDREPWRVRRWTDRPGGPPPPATIRRPFRPRRGGGR